MEVKSIIIKGIFGVLLILIVVSFINCFINIVWNDEIIIVTTLPIFLIDFLLVLDNINKQLEKVAYEYRYGYRNEAANEKNYKKRKLIEDKEQICEKIEIISYKRISRVLSTIGFIVTILIIFSLMFRKEVYELLKNINFNLITMISTMLLLIDSYYKEKIVNKLYKILFKILYKEDKKI